MNTLAQMLDTITTGDARELAQRIPDESVDLVLTDPPFGIKFSYGNGYRDDPAAYLELVAWLAGECDRIAKPGGLCFVFQGMTRLRETWPLFPTNSRIFAACKNWVQFYPVAVQFSFDPIIFWQKPGEPPMKYTGRDWFVSNTSPAALVGANLVDFHACPRPLDIITHLVHHYSPPGGIVCDFFMGSGTTAVAAKRLGRHWLGFEIDADTAQKARERVALTQMPLFVPEPEQLAFVP